MVEERIHMHLIKMGLEALFRKKMVVFLASVFLISKLLQRIQQLLPIGRSTFPDDWDR